MPLLRVPVVTDSPTVISTFAGCGGSSLGYRMAGYRELLAVEWDPVATESFRANFPGVPVHEGDIAELTGEECMRLAGIGPGELDVLDGSPPCQGFSTAGRRKLHDPRNGLFREFARLLGEIRPRAFVMENVTGLVKGHMRRTYLEMAANAAGVRVQGQGRGDERRLLRRAAAPREGDRHRRAGGPRHRALAIRSRERSRRRSGSRAGTFAATLRTTGCCRSG